MNGQSCSTVLVIHFDSGPTVFALLVGAIGLPGGEKFFLPPLHRGVGTIAVKAAVNKLIRE